MLNNQEIVIIVRNRSWCGGHVPSHISVLFGFSSLNGIWSLNSHSGKSSQYGRMKCLVALGRFAKRFLEHR